MRIADIVNSIDKFSLVFVERGRKIASDMGLTLLEANADNTSAVGDGARGRTPAT